MKLITFVISILLITGSFSIYSSTADEKKVVRVLDKQTSKGIFDLSDNHTVTMNISISFDLVELYEGHDNFISVMPCILKAVYDRIYSSSASEVKNTLEKSENKIIDETYFCMKNEIQAHIENLAIEYNDITDLGVNYELPKLILPPEPMTFEEWKAKQE